MNHMTVNFCYFCHIVNPGELSFTSKTTALEKEGYRPSIG